MSLLSLVKRNPEVRRIFGERELKIIEKQLMGVHLKPSERTRLSRDIRKKFAIIKELARFEEEFRLKKAAHIMFLVDKAKEKIMGHPLFPHVKRIILFGSAAENELRLGSDVDVAVEFDKISEKESFEFRINILGSLSDKMDVQVYNMLPDKIKKEIDKNGRVIFERKN